jgi:glycerophosphoryl diester phosphodiesterase
MVLHDRGLRGTKWIVEIKSYDRKGIDRVWRQVRKRKNTIISSFDPKVLRYLYVHHHAHNLYLVSRIVPCTIPKGVKGLIIGARFINRAVVKRLKPKYRILAWTVNDPEEFRRLRRIGVDGVVTDRLKTLYRNKSIK